MKKLYLLLIYLFSANCFSVDNYIYNFENNKINVFLAEKNNNFIKLGLEFFLEEDWKIYWKHPGDVGLPPSIEILEGSRDSDINIKWPLPDELYEDDIDLVSRVYFNYVILPIEILIKDIIKNKNHKIKLLLDFQICKDICIPVSKEFFVQLPIEDYKNSKNIKKLEIFEKKIPINLNSINDLQIKDVFVDKNLLTIEIKKNDKHKLSNNFNNIAFFHNNEIKTTRFIRFKQKEDSIFYYLTGFDNNMNIASNSLIYFKLEEKSYFWNASNINLKEQSKKFNIFIVIFFSFIGGFILNFMPCVLPVLGIKINSFIKELSNTNGNSIKLSCLSIVLGIISTFLFFAIVASLFRYIGKSVGWGMQFQSPGFIVFIIIILILFTLNLLGLFQIRLPQVINKFFAVKFNYKYNYYIKNYFTGVISTILATPCTAPFVGTAVSIALTQNFFITFLIFLFMALGKSVPYIIFILYPKVIFYFPKPGKWFNYLKYFFALLLVMTILWLVNIHSNIKETYSKNTNYNWQKFDYNKINDYIISGNSVFVDVTAKWCLTCLVNKKLVLNNEDIIKLFKSNNIIMLRADWTNRNEDILKYLNKYNRYGIPFNIFYSPNNPKGYIFSEVLTKKQIKKAIKESLKIK